MKLSIYLSLLSLPLSLFGKFTIDTLSVVLQPEQGKVRHLYQISNHNDENIPIEITITKSHFDEKGKETYEMNEEIEDAFILFPPQMVIPPNATRGFKLIYLGDTPEIEQAYRVIIEEKDIMLTEENTSNNKEVAEEDKVSFGLKILYKYTTRLWVRPSDVSGNQQIISFEKTETENKGEYQLSMLIENKGGMHVIFQNPKVELTLDSGEQITLTSSLELKKALGSQLLLAKAKRYYHIPWQYGWPEIDTIESIEIIEDEERKEENENE